MKITKYLKNIKQIFWLAVLYTCLAFPAYANICATPSEQQALSNTALQSQLMVAAITCNKQVDYNQFVTKFKPYLISQHRQLKKYFTRAYPGKWQQKLTHFQTTLANKFSMLSLESSPSDYCRRAEHILTQVIDSNTTTILTKIASNQQFNLLHGIKTCHN